MAAPVSKLKKELASRTSTTGPTHDEIAALAYALWEHRGRPDGSPEVDWLKAERSLLRSEHTDQSVGATEDEVNMRATVPQRIDSHGSKVEDIAGTGEQDAPGG